METTEIKKLKQIFNVTLTFLILEDDSIQDRYFVHWNLSLSEWISND